MAEIEGLNHTGRSAPDVREAEDFYVKILGAKHSHTARYLRAFLDGNGQRAHVRA